MASEDSVVFHKVDLPSQSFPVMNEIRRQGKLCDVTLKIEDCSITGHRIVLAATIPYFHAMFINDMAESKMKEVPMQGIDSVTLEALINYAYTGTIKMDLGNIQALIEGASYLQVYCVRDACSDFLKNRLQPDNVLGVRAFADTLGCTSLVEATNKFIQSNFMEVRNCSEFHQMSKVDILDILSCDQLNVPNEEKVFEAAINWVKFDHPNRKDDLPELMTRVRLPLLTPQYLTDSVATEDLVRTSLKCRDLLDEAKDYHLLPERRTLLQSFRTRPRCCTDIVGRIYAVGGLTKSGDSLSTVEMYDPIVGRWLIGEAMSTLRSRVGVAVLQGHLYAVGGYDGRERLNTVEAYDPDTRKWRSVAPMNSKRSALGTAVLNHRLYICGGYDGVASLNSVECYNPKRNEWCVMPNMNKARSAAGVTTLNGLIYVCGGHDGLSIFSSVEIFESHNKQWCETVPMLSKRCRLGLASLNGKLFACGGYDGSTFLKSVEMFDPLTCQWTFIAPLKVKRSRLGMVANCGRLYCIGGYDGFSNLSTVEMYDTVTDTWTFVACMCAHEGGVGVGVIPMDVDSTLYNSK